jgi:predicted negative regulator of RcsB-dependent stress response
VDDLLSEKEQLETIRAWWQEYGWYLLGGVVLGAAMLFGKSQYDDYRANEAETAGMLYQQLAVSISDDADAESLALLEQLREDYPSSPYTDQAGLLMAIMHLQNGSPRQAIESLESTIENTNDDYLAMVARVRIARLLVSSGRNDEALAILDSVEPGNFSARFSEIRGDIYFAQGDAENARNAYLDALNSDQSEFVDRGLIQMKIDDLAPTATGVAVEVEESADDFAEDIADEGDEG